MTSPVSEQRQLLQPFHPKAVKQREVARGYTADFVSWTDKLQRLYQLGLPFSWQLQPPTRSGDESEPVAVVGTLSITVDGVTRTVDGMGQGKDAKTASTDAFSRACAFLGLGLHLWCQGGEKDGGYWVANVIDKQVDPDTGEVQA